MNKKVWIFFGLIVLINAYFNANLDLHYDEAYYWVWSQNLSLSYFDHPPMVAYMIWLFHFLGRSEFFVRLPALVCMVITAIYMYKLANKMFNQKVAEITLLLAISWPMLEGVGFIMTPDSPLVMFWTLTVYCFYVGVFENKVSNIYFAGIFAGSALLSKYTALLVFPGLFLFLLTSKDYRNILAKKDVYLAFILSIIVFTPVIIWNYQHQWVSFLFQINHGTGGDHHISFATLFDYLGAQILITGPCIFLGLVVYLIKFYHKGSFDSRLAFLLWPSLFVFVFFTFCSLFKHMEGNWAAPSYILGIIFLAYMLDITQNKWVYRLSVGLILVIMVVAKEPLYLMPSKINAPWLNVFFGSKQMLNQAKPYITADTIILACDYGGASKVWYYLDNKVYVPNQFKFVNQYKYWNDRLNYPINKAVYICDSQTDWENLYAYFKNVKLVASPKFVNRVMSKELYIYEANN